MERISEEEAPTDEEDGDQAACSEDEEVKVTPACKPFTGGVPEPSMDILALRLCRELVHQDPEKSETGPTSGVMSESQTEVVEPERDAPSVSPSSLVETCSPSPSSLSSYFSSKHHHLDLSSSSSSSSSVLSLTPPLPPSVELSALLTDTKLTLDVYQGGAAALPLLWGSVPGQLRGLRYLRLGSEDQPAVDAALEVLPHLTELRSLAVRGHCFYDSHGDPLPGLLTTLPTSVSSLSDLVHLDLSFNQLSCLPSCLLSLPVLSSLLLCNNHLSALPPDIGQLSSLTYLSLLGNELVSLPQSLGQLQALQTLDISHNLLQQLPDEIGSLEGLVKLELSHNKLKQLPESMGSLLALRELVIYSNDIRLIPHCLNKLPLLKINVRDNPLGRPPTPPPLPPAPNQAETKIQEFHLGFNQHSFCVSSAGCHVFLPGGAELLFPPGCLVTTTRLKWVEKRPERKWVRLEEHDILLSRPLELSPHGITFLKPVEVCVPYHRTKRREVVVQKFDGESWSTLPTVLRRGSEGHSSHPGGRPARLACCSVSQFSWFMAVSRPVKDSCSVTPAGALLVSSADPGVKLQFPPDSTLQTRSITLQVLQVSVSEVQALCGDLRPDQSKFRSLCHLESQRCVGGVVRKVYQRLKQFKVQFLVLQRKTDPSQVMLQCLPSNKVESRVQSLSERYDGPQPSDLCDLLEGEQFFAGFEKGLDISTESRLCGGKTVFCVLLQHEESEGSVHLSGSGSEGASEGTSVFYRGEIPSNLPEEVARKRKGPDSQWLSTLPLRLPALNSENNFIMEEPQYPPLNLGDPESGYLTEANLLSISLQIAKDWRVIGINLGLSYQELDRIQFKYRDNLGALVLEMLFHWARGQSSAGPGAASRLVAALMESGRTDLAEEIEDIVSIGRRKYSESLRRVGLEEGSSSLTEAQQ
ncbi:hypothetical protein F7725_022958 [Dissostichus mawsoni]|uniref:Death domain-containing protein n=1 Tax=Dissostichus mawsoni TaxID=36200 RepID=A0A7J5Z095_DISMA|nr:hypothetical protein F7725_022958 [Dissostichus mawsoni]